jgi:CO/xanthine dehydrogenase FAD-binding subunit
MYEFNIVRPETLDEALELKKEHGEDLHPLAGGTDVLVSIRNNSVDWGPKPSLLNLNHLRELHFVNETHDSVEIGPLLTHAEIIENKVIGEHVPALCKAISFMGSPQIRNRGTIGGNVVHASPAADCLPILYARNSKVEVRTHRQTKLVPIQDFITGPGVVGLDPHGIVTKMVIPKLPGYVGDYLTLRQRRALSCNVVSVGVEMRSDDGRIEDIRVALGAVAPTVVRGVETESLLRDRKLSADLIDEAQALIRTECQPIDDVRSNGKYRRAMTGVLLARFLRDYL